ncbi:MAG: hypothetical protein ACT4P1_11180 [Sporichthyaceae bacterium]
MTTHAPDTSPGSTRRRRTTVWRGLGALLAIAALVAGPPVALLAVVGNPVPHQVLVGGQLTDAAVIGMLAAIIWVAWAQLMLVVTVEAIAAVGGGALPRHIPWCGFHQHLARRLVVAASLLLAGSSAVTATASGPAAAAVTQTLVTSCAAATAQVSAPANVTGPSVELRPVETESVQPVASVRPTVGEGRTSEAQPARALWYVVKPPHGHRHDSLWDIAERHLGDGLRWREVYDLNRDRPQPDGHRLELARLIQPGWRLLMPADATGISTEVERDRPTAVPVTKAAQAAAKSPTGASLIPHAREATPRVPTAPAPAATPVAEAPSTARADQAPGAANDPATEHTDDDPGVPFGALSMGLGVLACAGLTAELARRRRRTQRHRQPGERIRRPDVAAASVERVLRAANAELTIYILRDALRALAATCYREGRALPDLHAIQLNASNATLLLGTENRDAVAPFVAAGPRSWTLDARALTASVEGGGADLEDDAVDPYPALVALGVCDESILLVNLEAAGTLNLVGEAADTAPILNALIAELGTSALAASAQLVLTGCPPELVSILDAGRVTVLDTREGAAWEQSRQRDVAAILANAGVPDLAVARASRVAADVWAPAVVIRMHGTSEIDADEASAASPRSGLCVVTTGTSPAGHGWTLRVTDGQWTLDPAGFDLEPQRLDLATLPALVDLLDTTLVPAPESAPDVASAVSATSDGSERSPAGPDVDLAPPADSRVPSVLSVAAAVPEPFKSATGLGTSDTTKIDAPRVLVLGPVEIEGVSDDGAPGRRRRATELVAYLALHPGATQFQLDEALWPGIRVSRNTRNPLVSRTRQWLGANPAGEPHLGLVGEGGHYTLAPAVSCDWSDFCVVAKRGLAAGADGAADLIAALELVRGRPFLGVNPVSYAWAEPDTQDMISSIVDVAHSLADLSLAAGDLRRARWAASKGLVAEPFAELLYEDAIRAATALGDDAEASRMVAALRRQVAALEPEDDMGNKVASLLQPKRASESELASLTSCRSGLV